MLSEVQTGFPREGILFVVSAPSGAGKTTLCRRLIDICPDLGQSVSFTTRPPRVGEIDGRDYHFVTVERFETMVKADAFAEWAEVHGNHYGSARETLDQARDSGQDMLLEIDCQGALQLNRSLADAVFIFILPPSLAELERRLRGRSTESEDVVTRRLNNARKEIEAATSYDYLVVNDDLERAVVDLQSILTTEQLRISRLRQNPAECLL